MKIIQEPITATDKLRHIEETLRVMHEGLQHILTLARMEKVEMRQLRELARKKERV